MQENIENFNEAFKYAVKLLAKKDYSISKLSAKLLAKEFGQIEIENTIHKLKSLKYIDEENYTQNRIKHLLQKGFGDDYILNKLSTENLAASTEIIGDC